MKNYSYRSVALAVPTGLGRVQFLSGNGDRVSIVCAGSTGAAFRVADSGGSSFVGVFVVFSGLVPLVMPFRDYGPMVKGDIWISHNQAGTIDVVVTEIFILPGCK